MACLPLPSLIMSEMKRMQLSELLPKEGIDKLMEVMHGDYPSEPEFHRAVVAVLTEYKDSLEEKGVDHEYLAYALEAQLFKRAVKAVEHKPGIRVRVHDGSGDVLLGEGTYEGNVKVYFMVMPDGSLQSLENAELEPPAEQIPAGAEVVCTDDNPKIRLDSGQVVYGCQVWWEAIEEHKHGEGCGCHGT